MSGEFLTSLREVTNYRLLIAIGLPLLGGALVVATSILTPRGKAKGLVTAAYMLLASLGAACLIYAAIAMILRESQDVVVSWLVPGIVLTTIMGIFTPVIIREYQQFEFRKLAAAIFRRSQLLD